MLGDCQDECLRTGWPNRSQQVYSERGRHGECSRGHDSEPQRREQEFYPGDRGDRGDEPRVGLTTHPPEPGAEHPQWTTDVVLRGRAFGPFALAAGGGVVVYLRATARAVPGPFAVGSVLGRCLSHRCVVSVGAASCAGGVRVDDPDGGPSAVGTRAGHLRTVAYAASRGCLEPPVLTVQLPANRLCIFWPMVD